MENSVHQETPDRQPAASAWGTRREEMAQFFSPSQDNNSDDADSERSSKSSSSYRLILAVFFLVLTLAVQSSRNADLLSSILRPLYVFSCILFLFTIVGALCLERVRRLERFAWVQILFDLGAVTVLVYMTGGIESSFSSLYMLVIISSALLLNRRASLLTASACALVYGLLLDLQYFEWIYPLQLVSVSGPQRDSGTYFVSILMNTAGFFLVAFLAGYLAEELRKSSRRVQEREKDLIELATLHRSIVQSMSSGLLTVDLEGRIIFSNSAGERILGIRSAEIEGRSLTELFPQSKSRNSPASGRRPDKNRPPAWRPSIPIHRALRPRSATRPRSSRTKGARHSAGQ